MARLLACLIALVATLPGAPAGRAQSPPGATELLERSIEYHDPRGHWQDGRLRLALTESRPDGSDRTTGLLIDNRRGRFQIDTTRTGARLEGRLSAGECRWSLDGATDFTEADRETYRLDCPRLRWLRDYYSYLWGLPMKLRDPGTRLHPRVDDVRFNQQRVWAMRVTYDETVGSDTWYFYFAQRDHSLVGYRFYHDEAAGDGEYILLEGEIEAAGLRLPAIRSWYTNAEERYLGTDRLELLEVTRGQVSEPADP